MGIENTLSQYLTTFLQMPEIYLDLKANLQKQTIFHPLLNLVIACSEKEKLNQQNNKTTQELVIYVRTTI